MIYDAATFMHARRQHHICGVLTGNIPSANQQNIFSGLPLQLLPEEARVLVDKKHAFVVDDVRMHSRMLQDLTVEKRTAYRHMLKEEGLSVARTAQRQAEEAKIAGLKREAKKRQSKSASPAVAGEVEDDSESLFSSPSQRPTPPAKGNRELVPQFLTPTTSYPPLTVDATEDANYVPPVPASYPLFRYLHKHDYWMTPGLRFGCQYSVYPGDPLRFHSHFLASSMEWDEDINLMDIVAGGRLGTGVKKSFLIGGQVDGQNTKEDEQDKDVRVFSIEWAAM